MSSLLAVATLLTALVVLPITLPVIEAQAIAEGSPGSSIFWNDSGVANGGAKSHIYSFARLSTYYRSEGSNCTNTDARDDFFAARVNRNTNDPFIEFALWTPFDVSTKKSLYVVIIARLEYLVCQNAPYTRVYLINDGGYVNIPACESQNIEVANTNAFWQAFVFDLSGALSGADKITKIRWDYLQGLSNDTYGEGSGFQMDSFALFSNKDDANFFASERLAVRNNASYFEYKPCGLMNEVFGSKNGNQGGHTHNCHSEYNATERSIDLVADITCTNGANCPNAIYHAGECTGALNSSFDTQITLETSVPLKNYRYMVIVYRLGDDLGTLPAPGIDDSGQVYDTANHPAEPNKNAMGIYPHLNEGVRTGIHMQFPYYNNADYNVKYIDLEGFKDQIDDYDTVELTGVRIDPFEYSYVKNGARMHIYSIILCNDKAQTDSLINQQMGNYQRYLYQLNFNENKPGNSVHAVQNMPDSMTFYSNLAQYPSIYNLSKVQKPTRQYYDFLGWAENSGASVPDYAVNTQSGPQLYANTPKTLYAVWRFQTCTWTIKIGSALQNTGQVFLFKITGASHDPGVVSVSEIYVMLGGETGKTQETVYLPLGQYTATPVNAWNWRYDNTTSVTKTFTTGGAGETLTFSANGNHPLGVANNRWLNGFSCVIK